MRRAAADDGARGRIGPHFVNLSPQTKVAECGSSTEQIGAISEMDVQQSQHIDKTGLDLRRRQGVGADEPHPVDHAGPNLAGERGVLLLVRRRSAHPRDAAGSADLIDVAGPAVVEHPFVAPLVAEFLDQCGDEAGDGVIGMDRRFRKKLLHRVDNRRGVLNA